MKCLAAAIVLISLVATPQVNAEEQPEPIRILLTYGGHGFEQEPFFALFDSLPGVTTTRAEMPKDAGLLKPGLQEKYDAIVMYDMVRGITAEQQKAFVALLKEGIGLVSLHHNLGAHRDWDEFTKIIGGKFVFEDSILEGQPYAKSTWSHGEQMKVTVADAQHPIMAGLKDFEIHDETYGGYYTASGVHVLLKTDHPKNDPELAWTTSYGNSRVFFLMLGHDRHAWQNPAYGKILSQGIRWVADEK
jgi:type 1 glutamine amidotransferase